MSELAGTGKRVFVRFAVEDMSQGMLLNAMAFLQERLGPEALRYPDVVYKVHVIPAAEWKRTAWGMIKPGPEWDTLCITATVGFVKTS